MSQPKHFRSLTPEAEFRDVMVTSAAKLPEAPEASSAPPHSVDPLSSSPTAPKMPSWERSGKTLITYKRRPKPAATPSLEPVANVFNSASLTTPAPANEAMQLRTGKRKSTQNIDVAYNYAPPSPIRSLRFSDDSPSAQRNRVRNRLPFTPEQTVRYEQSRRRKWAEVRTSAASDNVPLQAQLEAQKKLETRQKMWREGKRRQGRVL